MSDTPKPLAALLKKLRTRFARPEDQPPPASPHGHADADPLVAELVYSLLLWECAAGQAVGAFRRLVEGSVDFNEVRVFLPDETLALVGERYPLARERCERLRAALNDLFRRRHALTLSHLREMSARDAREFLESLEGVPQFVAARVALLGLEAHAVPVDRRLRALLLSAGVGEPEHDEAALGAYLERHVRAAEAREVHELLRAWSDDEGVPPAPTALSAPTAAGAPRDEAKAKGEARPEGKAEPKPGAKAKAGAAEARARAKADAGAERPAKARRSDDAPRPKRPRKE